MKRQGKRQGGREEEGPPKSALDLPVRGTCSIASRGIDAPVFNIDFIPEWLSW